MDSKIINLYCDNVIKPLQMRKNELEMEIYTKKIVSLKKRKEYKILCNLLHEKYCYLSNLINNINDENN